MKNAILKTNSIIWILIIFLSGCSFPLSSNKSSSRTQLAQAEVVFQVVLPKKIEDGYGLYLEIIDEVTGIYFNPDRYSMSQNSETVFLVRLPLTIGAEINYRYIKIKDTVENEYNSRNQAVLSRKIIVNGPELVQDSIFGWADDPYLGPVGRIRGQIIDQGNNAPLPDMIINSSGLQTTSSSDGTFILENIPVGTHNVVIMSKDASVIPFQQYATVSDNATTPIYVNLKKRDIVKISFVLSNIDTNNLDKPIRIAGNISTLGNPFALLEARSANRSDNLPQLNNDSKNKYLITLNLPAGAYLKYKYTQGDGFWNSELDAKDDFVLRELIVPAKNTTIYDEIEKFQTSGKGMVDFTVTLASGSPVVDSLYLQFNPYDWMEPVPMTQTGTSEWRFSLSSPLNLIGNTAVRVCRNGDCGKGLSSEPVITFTPAAEDQPISINIDQWQNYETLTGSPAVDNGGLNIIPNSNLISGVEIVREIPESWVNTIDKGFDQISNLGGKWVILSPTWSISTLNTPMIEPTSKTDTSWADVQKMINFAKLKGLQPVIFPQLSLSSYPDLWNGTITNDGWWQTFYDRYERFIVNYADLAEIMGASAIILGDPSVAPSMDQNPEAEKRWLQLIDDVRARFSGQIIGVIALPSTQSLPTWLTNVDMIYVLFSPEVEHPESIIDEFSNQLDTTVYPIYQEYQKPIIVGVNFSSNDNAFNGCIDLNGSCAFNNDPGGTINLLNQASLYNAISAATFSKTWVSGLISRGYYPFLKSTDSGSSIYGKSAFDILWFWYHYALNLAT